MEGRNIKVKDLLNALKQYDPEAGVTLRLRHHEYGVDTWCTDNYILKLFRSWAALGYDITSGKRTLKKDYCAEWLKVRVANRAGDVYQEIVFKDVMINGALDFTSDLDYSVDDALELTVKFVSDWWEEITA